MFKYKGKTLRLLIFLLLTLLQLTCGRSLHKKLPLDIQVLNPSEFVIHLSQEEKGGLVKFRVNINEELSNSRVADFEEDKTDEDTLRFFNKNLRLKRGDIIYYSGLFEDDTGHHGDTGSYLFNGVYKNSNRDRRESSEDSSDDDDEEETNPIESRFGHHRRGYGRRRGPDRRRGYGPPPPFWPPGPHHDTSGSPFGFPPPFHRRPGSWDGYDHGPRDKFGNSDPWDGHGYKYGGGCGESDGTGNKPWSNKGNDFNENQGFKNKKPWQNNGTNDLGKNINNSKPNNVNTGNSDGSDGFGNNSGSNSVNNNSFEDSERNGFNFGSTTEKPMRPTTTQIITTTQKTTIVPNIDIRFAAVDEE